MAIFRIVCVCKVVVKLEPFEVMWMEEWFLSGGGRK
jgi:hypothetical protein